MYEARIRHLESIHESLDQQIDTMERTGVFDDKQMQTLKKQRLQIRDELHQLRSKRTPKHG